MNSLRKKLDKLKPHFSEGGRFAKLKSVFEGFESFIFVPNKVTFRGQQDGSAVYLYRIEAGSERASGKMIFLK